MVVGGGIAGMQCSLDLANTGYRVYLVERDISIGGVMAQLDKTFPTNDCSTCMISPKLLEVAGHPNIDILTRAKVESLEGEPGHFVATVTRAPRYVKEDLCTGCGECVKVCPVESPASFNEGLNPRKAIFRHFPQAIPSAFAIDKTGISPCKAACPAGISVQGYIALIAQKRYRDALDLIRQNNPLPAICGRVCHRPCESVCNRAKVDEPVAIDYLKRFVADLDLQDPEPPLPPKEEPKGKKVAVVGSGPGGLSAAYYLALKGYEAVIFEALAEPGGWLRYGIPAYRLPRDVLDAEIRFIQRLGVEIRCNTVFGKDVTFESLRREGYEAFFLAMGTPAGTLLQIPGEDLPGVYTGADFLRKHHQGVPLQVGRRVAVVGGGNAAVDSARVALRLGAQSVQLFYRRTRNEMPAIADEIEDAEAEGVEIHLLTAPVEILADESGRASKLRLIRMELGEADESGRRRPVPILDSEYDVPVDTVVSSIGLRTDASCFESRPEADRPRLTRRSTLVVDPLTRETSMPGVFAGGDAVTGPATVVEAIGAGREAAISIDRYFQGEDLTQGRVRNIKVLEEPDMAVPKARRVKMPHLPAKVRRESFDEIMQGLSEEDVLREAHRCLQGYGTCSECFECVGACMANAIDHDDQPVVERIRVGAVIDSAGFRPFDANLKEELGHGRYPNVVTSLEFERLLSASGPTDGHIRRPGDGAAPRRVAWIQCVGSRDASIGQDYCSSVCCMYATKQAIVAGEHEEGLETTVFFIDMRAMGKGFERYYERAKEQYGVRYVRSHISRVVEAPQGGDLEIQYIDETGAIRSETFHMVVLSVGLKPSPDALEAARVLGLETDRFGFLQAPGLDEVATSRPGVFSCGVSQGPKDIPETVAQASAAAASAQCLLGDSRDTLTAGPPDIVERPVSGEIPRIGVFICHCGINIAGVVDVEAVTEYTKTLPNVVFADHLLFSCATDSTEKIKEIVKERELNRVVVASCSPRTHQPLFQSCIYEAGLNKYLFEMANIRDQCSWVHGTEHEKATEKAKDLVRMAVAKATFLEPLHEVSVKISQKALVVGGGVAGMTAALHLADQGYHAYLVEKEAELGGNAKRWMQASAWGVPIPPYVDELVEKVESHPGITVFKESEVREFSGHGGHFQGVVRTGDLKREIEYGALVVATGGEEYQPKEGEYLYGTSDKVTTQLRFRKALENGDDGFDEVRDLVMIQCVGSRNDEHPYCSRVCCTTAVTNAARFKEKHPRANVSVLYRDIRTFGVKELLYKKAREAGVRFFRFEPENGPEVRREGDGLKVAFLDRNLDENVELRADRVVLSAGIVPAASNPALTELFKLQLDADGFFMEAHVKLQPLDFAGTGTYLCGLSHSPKFLEEAISQAKGAASRAATLLSKEEMYVGGRVAVVDPAKCSVCLTCVRTCPFGVPKIVTPGHSVARAAYIDPAACQGCGACVAECPSKAIQLQYFTDPQLIGKTRAAMG